MADQKPKQQASNTARDIRSHTQPRSARLV